jgi:type IV secretion system protein VirB10
MSDSQNEDMVNVLDGERGIPNVSSTPSTTVRKVLYGLFVVLMLFAIGGYSYWHYLKKEQKNAPKDTKAAFVENHPTRKFDDYLADTTASESPIPVKPDTPPPSTQAALPLPNKETKTAEKVRILDKGGSDLMAVESKDSKGGKSSGNPADSDGDAADSNGDDSLGNQLKATKTETRLAKIMRDRNFLLAEGAFINCGLHTKIVTTVSGKAKCVVTRDIYSDNGKVLLVERGSVVTGEYRSRSIRQGMARIFVLWTRIRTGSGVEIALNSTGTDELGAAGVPGYIDTHFWDRFGGALMLSVVDSLAAGLASSVNGGGGGNNNYNLNGLSSNTQNIAAEALKNTINIPPTLYKNQGEEVGIYVVRDLDFSTVYELAAAEQ